MKAAVFLPNWLGDLVMATPVLRALRRKFGRDARLVGILRPHLAAVLAGTNWLDEQWFYDPRSRDRTQRAWAVAQRMRIQRFDLAIMLTNSLRPALMSWRAGARERIGYVRYGRGPLLTRRLYHRRVNGRIAPEPTVETYLAIADALGCGYESPRLQLATTDNEEQSADAVFTRLGLRSDGRLILLNSSGAYGAAKLWPSEYFGRLARLIVDKCGHDVLVMCGPDGRAIANEIVKHSGSGRVFSMADQPPDLGTAKACIRRGRLMVSTDSGPRHVAAALGRPVITLYGPMLPLWGENPTQRAIDLALDLDCIGCHKRTCPLGHHRCMRELSVDMVFAAVLRILENCPLEAELSGIGTLYDFDLPAPPAAPAAPHFPGLIGGASFLGSGHDATAPA
jgi:heptosyltransferase-2